MTEGAIGILGGTFDPPHIGHLLMGECARVQLGLREVRFLPAGDPYQKTRPDLSPAADRLAMVRLAVADNPGFVVDEREVRRTGATYTVDTLRELQAEGMTDLVLILGSDAVQRLPTWREPEAVAALATFAIAPKGKGGVALEAAAREAGLAEMPLVIDMPPLDVSSTVIRERLKRGAPVRYLLPGAVLDYVWEHGLYGLGR